MRRQGHGLARNALGVRMLALAPAETPAGRAKMQRFVRHAGADAARLHRVAEAVAIDRHAFQREQDAEHVQE
jgi:hypothetical protein